MGIFETKREIRSDSVIQRSKNLLFSEIHDEIVALSVKNSEYYGMDKVASSIFKLLEEPLKFNVLVAKLISKYEITEKQCSSDTQAFLLKLADKELIIIQ
jgi:Coenzyme PQQ synthesis protein D (PqqD)